jgi:hypothetical protein
VALAGIATSLLVPLSAGAQTAPTWLAAADVSTAGGHSAGGQVAIDEKGDLTAVWVRWTGTASVVQAAVRPAGGIWQVPTDLSEPASDVRGQQLAVDSKGNALALWLRRVGTAYVVEASLRPVGSSWQRAERLSAPGADVRFVSGAVDSRGVALAVWSTSSGGAVGIVEAASHPAGGRWQPAVRLSEPGGEVLFPSLAVDRRGNAVAVWTQVTSDKVALVQAARRAAGGPWQAPETLSRARGYDVRPRIAFDRSGNALAVWQHTDGSSIVIQSATRPVDRVWTAPTTVSGPAGQAFQPNLAVDARGNAVAVWVRLVEDRGVIQAALRDAQSGSWRAPQDLSAPTGSAEGHQLAMNGSGSTIVVWTRTNFVIQAVRRAGGGAWQAPEDLSPVRAERPQVAIDANGNGVVVWARNTGTNEAYVQAAGYDAAGPQLRGLRIPAKGKRGARLSFSVSPLDVWSGVGTTNWRFGDGGKANGAKASHVYRRPGRFTVTVTSEDGLGHTTTVTRVVRVRG